jgi:hypothetical protein
MILNDKIKELICKQFVWTTTQLKNKEYAKRVRALRIHNFFILLM